MKILASLLIVLAFGAGCARRTVVYEPAASPATIVTTPTVTTPVLMPIPTESNSRAGNGSSPR